jgi:DNA-binding NtrC family response regulator
VAIEQARPGTILVIEDEAILRMLAADHLRTLGYRVIEAATADEATTIIQSGEHVDLAFCDVQLPGSMGGLTFAVWVRANYPGTQVILTSGNGSVLGNFRSGGAFPFISKPYDLATVADWISSLLSNRARAESAFEPRPSKEA